MHQTFRAANNDQAINEVNAATIAGLNVADGVADLNDARISRADDSILMTQPAGSLLDFDRTRVGRDESITLMDPSLPFLSSGLEQGLNADDQSTELFADDLGLDIGEETSIHRGMDAPTPRLDDMQSEDGKLFDGDDLELDLGEGVGAGNLAESALGDGGINFEGDEDIEMGDGEAFNFNADDSTDLAAATAPTPGLLRDSQSPPSSIRSSVERDLENYFQPNGDSGMYDEDESLHLPQRARKRKILQPDSDTVLHSKQIKEQQENRSKILKPPSFLPRDPMMLTLMNMQRNGGFVSSIFGDVRDKGWAPELKGLFSFETVKRSGELKRKRDSGVADVGEDEALSPNAGKQPRLEFEDDGDMLVVGGIEGADTTLGGPGEVIEIAADDGIRAPQDNEDDDEHSPAPGEDPFMETTAPLIHPADNGPVSLGTQHAVHLLRERFGPSLGESPAQQKKANVLFQDLLPEATTSKADATKMFFEVLVLATKDAVKVEQPDNVLGGPLRIRGKRGLWGAWAEEKAGGEIAEQANMPIASSQMVEAAA